MPAKERYIMGIGGHYAGGSLGVRDPSVTYTDEGSQFAVFCARVASSKGVGFWSAFSMQRDRVTLAHVEQASQYDVERMMVEKVRHVSGDGQMKLGYEWLMDNCKQQPEVIHAVFDKMSLAAIHVFHREMRKADRWDAFEAQFNEAYMDAAAVMKAKLQQAVSEADFDSAHERCFPWHYEAERQRQEAERQRQEAERPHVFTFFHDNECFEMQENEQRPAASAGAGDRIPIL